MLSVGGVRRNPKSAGNSGLGQIVKNGLNDLQLAFGDA